MTRRILIVRTSAIGDVVLSTPFASALRRTYPDAYIAWLVLPTIAPLLQPDPTIDELILWPLTTWKVLWQKRRWWTLIKEIRVFSQQLRQKRFDLAIDLQGLLKSGIPARMTCATERVGLGSREGSQYLMTQIVPWLQETERVAISSEYEVIAQQLGLNTMDFVPRLHIASDTDTEVAQILAAHQLTDNRYAILAPFTTRPQKHWHNEGWRQLIPLLAEQLGLTSVVVGDQSNRVIATDLIRGQRGAVSLAGTTTLAQTAALAKRAALVIGVDTSVTHMGPAVGTPSVALFGSTRPYISTGNTRGQVIWSELPCAPCRRHPTCGGAFTCMMAITPQLVIDRATLALKSRTPATRMP